MRPLHAAVAALAILVMGASVVAGARVVKIDTDDMQIKDTRETAAVPGKAPAAATTKIAAGQSPNSGKIDQQAVAKPKLESGEFERIEPRAPLSDLALAMPPKPPKTKMPEDWKGTPLYQPVASAAGIIDAKGYSVAISGIDIVKDDETCDSGGTSWPCGIRARTAFRAFLRGRAVVCSVPPEGGRDLIAAQCRIGKQDLGEWLVENGWARAVAGGPYAEAGDKARTDKKGIFGPAPDLSGLPPAPARITTEIAPSGSILDLSGEQPAPAADEPPSDQPATPQVFPPAPAR